MDRTTVIEDRRFINTSDDKEFGKWVRAFGCTPDELLAAVNAVGNSASKVREYLEFNT